MPAQTDTLPPFDWPGEPSGPKADGFVWPTPPFAAYPAPRPQAGPLPVEITAANGSRSIGQLLRLLPTQRIVHLLVPPAKQAMPVRLAQLACLKLIRPVPVPPAQPAASGEVLALDLRPRIEFKLQLRNGQTLRGSTIGHVQDDLGLFLFLPVGPNDDSVQQLLVPREAVESCDFGERLGELLVAEQLASSEQVEAAVSEQLALRRRKVGDILVANQVVSPEQLLEAIDAQSRMPIVRIGEALVAMDLVTQTQLDEALAQQQQDRSVPLGELLVRRRVVSRAQLQSALARKMGYPLVDVERFPSEIKALRRLTLGVAKRLGVLPLIEREGRLIVAMEDPTRREAIDEAEFISQLKVVPALTKVGSLVFAIPLAYQRVERGERDELPPIQLDLQPSPSRAKPAVQSPAAQIPVERQDDRSSERTLEPGDNSLVKLVNTMILEAQARKVSDIHIECLPGREKLRIRFRQDGVLSPYLELAHVYRQALVARLKQMADLDVAERLRPQDGRIQLGRFLPNQGLELRIATIPTQGGLEDVVLQLLEPTPVRALSELGLTSSQLSGLQQALAQSHGLLLCAGPPGSGRTSTLHAMLAQLNRPDRKIWTAEDPVEITQPGLRQVQINPRMDWTFAKALRALQRADPDVIMVGELRERESVELAIEAALSNSLLLSSLPSRGAVQTLVRLVDMGADPERLADALIAVLAQTLVRRLCPHCRVAEALTPSECEELVAEHLQDYASLVWPERPEPQAVQDEWLALYGQQGRLQRWHAPGCEHCGGGGLLGRVALYEFLHITPALRRLMRAGASAEELQLQALRDGMRSLRQDGLSKLLQGQTTPGEVRAGSLA